MEHSRFYPFVLSMWVNRSITETQVRAYVPKYITADERDLILATPQKD